MTGKCNFSCPYCFGEDVKKPGIDAEVYSKVISFAKHCRTSIGFTGGEPLLHPNFRDLVKAASKSNIPLILRTNGMLLGEYMDVIKSFQWIGISIDGADEKTVKRMRPSTSNFDYQETDKWNTPLENIKLINNQNPETKILLASLVSSFNYKALIRLAEIINSQNLNVSKWKLYQFTRNNFRSMSTSTKYETTTKYFEQVVESIRVSFKGDVIYKSGTGNCLLIDTKGTVRVNETIVGSVFEDFQELENKVRRLTMFKQISLNKVSTYDSE
ncbi:radical SAM protein [Pseudoalteromonas distincta]|uniref:radical SAM protein n=1 Tax=Pseudoalteromonas distincta TaxID=77608 RepID=UPI00241CCF27|nr:radical SAM protein [Pseudoalteromonas distincta]